MAGRRKNLLFAVLSAFAQLPIHNKFLSPYRAHLYNRSPRDGRSSSLARGAWATVKLLVFLTVVVIAGWLFFQDQIRTKLCSTVECKVNDALAGTGIETSIGNANFVDGKGMLLSNMRTTAPNVALTAYETFLSMDSNTTDLVTGNSRVDAIEMRRVQLEIFKSADGSFDLSAFSKIAESIRRASNNDAPRLIPITMLDSQVRLIDQAVDIDRTISDINFQITPVEHDGRTILQVVATAAAAEVQQATLKAFVDPEFGDWNADLTLNSASLNGDLIALLPQKAQQQIGPSLSLSSRIDGSFNANGNWRNKQLHWFEGNGKVVEFSAGHDRIPGDIRNASAIFHVTPDGATLSEVRGQMGTSPFEAHFTCTDLQNPKNWHIAGRLDQFRIDRSERIIRAMPSAEQFLNDFQVNGLFDVQFDVQFDGNRITKTIDTQISKLAFNFVRFPYPMTNCQGTARWVNDQFTYDLKHLSRDRALTATGVVNNPGKLATWQCELNVARGQLPFDEKLKTALDVNPSLAKTVRAFDANGWIGGNAIMQKRIPGGEVEKQFNIDVLDMTIKHERFPYLIKQVNGKITTVNHALRFEQLTGVNGIGRILCNGTWNPQAGLNVRYVCNDIELDEELRQALRMELKEVWDGFRPRGKVEMMTVDMTLRPGQKECNLVVDSQLNGESKGLRKSNLSIYPTWFPYELNNLAGRLAVADGKILLRKFRGQHGRTEVSCDGDGSYSPRGWDMSLTNLLTQSLRADEQLLRALPESLSRPIQYMKFDGLLNVKGTMTLAGQYREPAVHYAHNIPQQQFVQTPQGTFIQQASVVQQLRPKPAPKVSMGWDMRFDMNQAEMFLGIPVQNVFGFFTLIGQFDGDNVECRGAVNLDSLTIYDAQITNIRGPVWFDNYQALAGGLINQLPTGQTAPSITGEMAGGVAKLDAAISSDREGRFVIQTTLADGDLKELARELSPNIEGVEGRTIAALKMEGDASGTHTCRGQGQIHVRNAQIYEFPPVVRILKLIHGRRVDDVAFDSGDIFFVVNGENIDINRMEFNGDAISIIGNGRMNTDHDIDLNFYSVIGRNKINIPLISDLYRRSSQKFMWINVGGTCQNPKISTEILPELNDSLRQLFQQDQRQAQGTVYQNLIQR